LKSKNDTKEAHETLYFVKKKKIIKRLEKERNVLRSHSKTRHIRFNTIINDLWIMVTDKILDVSCFY